MKKASSWSLGSEGALWEAPPVVDPSHFRRVTFTFGRGAARSGIGPGAVRFPVPGKEGYCRGPRRMESHHSPLCPSPSPFPCPHQRLCILTLTFSPAPISTSSPAPSFQHSNFKCRALSPRTPTTPSSVAFLYLILQIAIYSFWFSPTPFLPWELVRHNQYP